MSDIPIFHKSHAAWYIYGFTSEFPPLVIGSKFKMHHLLRDIFIEISDLGNFLFDWIRMPIPNAWARRKKLCVSVFHLQQSQTIVKLNKFNMTDVARLKIVLDGKKREGKRRNRWRWSYQQKKLLIPNQFNRAMANYCLYWPLRFICLWSWFKPHSQSARRVIIARWIRGFKSPLYAQWTKNTCIIVDDVAISSPRCVSISDTAKMVRLSNEADAL